MSERYPNRFKKGQPSLMKGKKHAPETKEKISRAKRGIPSGRKGEKSSEETRKKLRESHLGKTGYWGGKKRPDMTGENHPRWKGGYKNRLFLNIRRKVQKRANGGNHTLGEWENLKAQCNWSCVACERREPDIKLTEDHIIPLSRGGSDNLENIQPLCQSCNSRKYTKMPDGGMA